MFINKMGVSIGIMAYNEEKNIGNLLSELIKQDQQFIKEIIVVNDGSTDKTSNIVKQFLKYPKIKLIDLEKRKGKVNAINQFLNKSKSEIIVLESADTLPKKDAIYKLFKILKENPKIGIVGAHIMPTSKGKKFATFFGKLIYELHHQISLKKPKFGELIAFKNIIKKLPLTAVDEEYLAMLIKSKGYQFAYCPEAFVYNKQPDNIKDLIKQRRRIHAGHTDLNKKGYTPPTYKLKNIMQALIKNFKLKETHLILGSIILEGYVRWLGFYDHYFKRKDHYIWDIADSTKEIDKID